MARSLNKVELIGNLTRDPELRYTPQGTAVCTFGLATNRQWVTDSGEKKEDVEFHRIVAWNKLAELCAQLLSKGRKVYVEGRLQSRRWTGQGGNERTTTEIVINDMIILDSRGAAAPPATRGGERFDIPEELIEAPVKSTTLPEDQQQPQVQADTSTKPTVKTKKTQKKEAKEIPDKKVDEDDIPF